MLRPNPQRNRVWANKPESLGLLQIFKAALHCHGPLKPILESCNHCSKSRNLNLATPSRKPDFGSYRWNHATVFIEIFSETFFISIQLQMLSLLVMHSISGFPNITEPFRELETRHLALNSIWRYIWKSLIQISVIQACQLSEPMYQSHFWLISLMGSWL